MWESEKASRYRSSFYVILSIPTDYPWETLKSPIVDIGGGIGSLQVMLLSVSKNENLSFIILDLEKTVDHAKKVMILLIRVAQVVERS